MNDYSDARFYAISTFGYGKGFTAEEAEKNYLDTQARNFPAEGQTRAQRIEWMRKNAAPTVFEAPEGTTGFYIGSGYQIVWTAEGREDSPATDEQKVTLASKG